MAMEIGKGLAAATLVLPVAAKERPSRPAREKTAEPAAGDPEQRGFDRAEHLLTSLPGIGRLNWTCQRPLGSSGPYSHSLSFDLDAAQATVAVDRAVGRTEFARVVRHPGHGIATPFSRTRLPHRMIIDQPRGLQGGRAGRASSR